MSSPHDPSCSLEWRESTEWDQGPNWRVETCPCGHLRVVAAAPPPPPQMTPAEEREAEVVMLAMDLARQEFAEARLRDKDDTTA